MIMPKSCGDQLIKVCTDPKEQLLLKGCAQGLLVSKALSIKWLRIGHQNPIQEPALGLKYIRC